MAEPQAQKTRGLGTWADLVMLSVAVVAVGAGIFIYTDRDGPGRTQDGLVAADFIQVAPNVAEALLELAVADNQHVETGALLFRLDDRPYRARLQAAQGEHARALADQADKKALLERTQAAATHSAVSRQALADAIAAKDRTDAAVLQTAGELALAFATVSRSGSASLFLLLVYRFRLPSRWAASPR